MNLFFSLWITIKSRTFKTNPIQFVTSLNKQKPNYVQNHPHLSLNNHPQSSIIMAFLQNSHNPKPMLHQPYTFIRTTLLHLLPRSNPILCNFCNSEYFRPIIQASLFNELVPLTIFIWSWCLIFFCYKILRLVTL